MTDKDVVAQNLLIDYKIAGPTGGSGATGWAISNRTALTTFPVPTLRPTTVNTNLAFDLMPNGSPGNAAVAPLSVCWFDVCNSDVLTTNGATSTARVGCGSTYAEFGSYLAGGGTQLPMIFTMSGSIVGQYSVGGDFDYTSLNGNARTHCVMTNTNAGTSSYTDMGVGNAASGGAQLLLRAYSTGWTAVAGDQNYGELCCSSSLAGLNLTVQNPVGVMRFLVGGSTPGAPGVGVTVATVNPTGATNAPGSFVWNYPIIPPTYTVGTLPTPASALKGARAWVSDQLTSLPAWGGALTGGGALACPCWCTGAAWVAG